MKTVAPMRESLFERKIARDSTWKEVFENICETYRSLHPSFKIGFDSFGGYRLLYTGNEIVNPPTVFRKQPLGFVKAVPENAVSELSVMSSVRTGEQLLLIGPLRFVNSDCNPNVEYDFAGDSGFVKLRVKRRILPGDELLVKYGPEFFDSNECRCRTCDIQKKDEYQMSEVFEILLVDLISVVFHESVDECKLECGNQLRPPKQKKRLRGLQLV